MIKINEALQTLFESSKWGSDLINRCPIESSPLLRFLKEQEDKRHIELKKYYSDYDERNEENPFDWAWDKKRGRPSNAILMGRIFNELWYKDKVEKFGINPFSEYDEKFNKPNPNRTITVQYNQATNECK